MLISTINLLDIANGWGAMADTKLLVKTTKLTLIPPVGDTKYPIKETCHALRVGPVAP